MQKYKENGNFDRLIEIVKEKSINLKFWLKKFIGGLTMLCLIGLAIIPIFIQDPYYLRSFFIKAMIYTIFAASWDFLAGFVGQVSFGHAIFLGMGGYITGFLLVNLNMNWILALLIGALGAIALGLIIAIPALRLKGPYFALGTLVFGVILYTIFKMPVFDDFIPGITGIPKLSTNPVISYYIHFIFMIISLITLLLITKSNFGTTLKAIRDDDKGARASGINISKKKIIAFIISALFASIAGGLFAMFTRSADYGSFQVQFSFYPVIFASIGGIATITGSALGAFFFILVLESLVYAGGSVAIGLLILSIILLIVIRFAEEGMLKPAVEHLKDLYDVLMAK
ncbi:MAG: branched-chain amino acid ABC transporter permease [Promethearchaeati archaeon]